jgi:hypothetical protein
MAYIHLSSRDPPYLHLQLPHQPLSSILQRKNPAENNSV